MNHVGIAHRVNPNRTVLHTLTYCTTNPQLFRTPNASNERLQTYRATITKNAPIQNIVSEVLQPSRCLAVAIAGAVVKHAMQASQL